MAVSTYKTFLMRRTDLDVWEKVVDIKDYPDLGGEPDMLQKTDMSQRMHTYIPGVQDTGALEFTSNYDLVDYKAVKALEGSEETYAVWFGGDERGETVIPTGSDGKYKFTGMVSVYAKGAGVNDVREMTITIAPTSEIVLDEE